MVLTRDDIRYYNLITIRFAIKGGVNIMIIATKSLAKRRIEQGLSRSELARTLSLSH